VRAWPLEGKPVFVYSFVDLERMRWEGADASPPGRHTLEFEFKYDGLGLGPLAFNSVSGIGRGGTGVLEVDGKELARGTMEHSIPLICNVTRTSTSEPIAGTRVDDRDHQVPFRFTGKLNRLTLTIDRPAPAHVPASSSTSTAPCSRTTFSWPRPSTSWSETRRSGTTAPTSASSGGRRLVAAWMGSRPRPGP
jgi:hypothetical protein